MQSLANFIDMFAGNQPKSSSSFLCTVFPLFCKRR